MTASPPEIAVGDDPGHLWPRAARRIADASKAAVAARGGFAVALAGGSTPRALYALLAEEPWRSAIAWPLWDVHWTDERCVPPDHADSNSRLARETLLDRVPVDPERVHRIRGEEGADRAARAADAALRALGRPLDLALLGLGPDGHTASLFPGSAALAEEERLAVAVAADSAEVRPPRVDRVTLTPPALRAARAAIVLATGAEKAAAVAGALAGAPLPIRAALPTSGAVLWLLDAAAASSLPAAAGRA